MRYYHFIPPLMACLFAMMPWKTLAQQLTGYDYWFDGDQSTLVSKNLSGYEAEVDADIPTQHLSDGMHTLYLRVRQSGGEYNYSAVTSAVFFKHNVSEGNQIEYWFDDKYDERVSMGLPQSATEELTEINFDLRDDTKFPMGLHQLNMRVSTEGKCLNSVYSAWVLKITSGNPDIIEYWVDGDFANRKTVSGHLSASGENDYVFVNPFDLSGIPAGVHRVYYRIASNNGSTKSAVSMATVVVGSGDTPTLEYWIDDDREHANTISGHEASAGDRGVIFNNSLNFENVSEGVHRLHLRGIGSNGISQTAITSTPIMVKSRYNVSSEETESLTVTEHAYWFDDEEPEVVPVDNPKNIITQPYTFDTRRLSEGQHTLHVQYGNSAGIWNGPVSYNFTKTKVVPPQITANASVENGVVTLNYNAVPAGFQYVVVRKYPSGTIRKADVNRSTEYPANLKSTDTPSPGTYTYYVEGKYTDASGAMQEVRSGEVSVTVGQAASTVERGTIYGVLTLEGKRIDFPRFNGFNVYINGKKNYDSDFSYSQESSGQFKIGNVPYGTEITIGVEYRDYFFKDVTLIVSENTCNKPYYFNGTMEGGEDLQPSNDEYDLTMTSDVHITPDAVELEVWNYSKAPWSGNIIVKMIKKSTKDLDDKLMSEEGLSFLDYLLHPASDFEEKPIYTTIADTHISVDGKKWGEYNNHKVLSLEIIDMPEEKDKTAEYYVYVYSRRDDSEELKELAGYTFPRTVELNPYDCEIAQEKDFKSYLNDYKTIMKQLKMLSKWGDPFAFEIQSFGDDYEKIIENLGNEKYISWDGVEHDLIAVASQSSGMLLSCFLSDVHKAVKSAAKSLKTSFDVANVFEDLVNTLNDFYNSVNQVDDNHKFFATCKQVLKFCEKKDMAYFPALKVYKYYFEVGDAMASAIESFSNNIHSDDLWDRIVNNRAVYNIKVRRYTGTKGVSYFDASEFSPDGEGNHPGRIKSIDFFLSAPGMPNGMPSTSCETSVNNYSTLEVKNVDFPINVESRYTNCELWMNITWNNNRVTHVPMLNSDFVKIENLRNPDKPLVITVELQADTYLKKEYISKNIKYVKQ